MMRIAVVGGRLQGMEACYLARKAGIESVLVDMCPSCPAAGLADAFIEGDVRHPAAELIRALKSADMVLPANENDEALGALKTLTEEYALNTAFDFAAYAITSSKRRSDALFHENGIPSPAYYPDCEPPYIFKPSHESGSAGVLCFDSRESIGAHIASLPAGTAYVAQEYVEGPSYSIEVIGVPGDYRTYQITGIHIDEAYDCNRVTCPCGLPDALEKEFSAIALKLAGLVNLCGIMDVEAILHNGVLKVLEIDARLPSQTPTAIYHSTGVNFVAELAALFTKKLPRAVYAPSKDEKHTVFAHIEASAAGVRFPGEHIMASRAPVRVIKDFFGADEAVTDWKEGDAAMCATLIESGRSADAAAARFEGIISRIREKLYNI